MILYLHTLWNHNHDKSSNHLPSYKIITILLIIYLMLYITSPWFIYYITGGLYLLIPFSNFTHWPQPLLSGNHLFVLCIYESVFVLFFRFYILVQYLSFASWLISLSIIPSRSIHTVLNGKISYFLWLSEFPLYI